MLKLQSVFVLTIVGLALVFAVGAGNQERRATEAAPEVQSTPTVVAIVAALSSSPQEQHFDDDAPPVYVPTPEPTPEPTPVPTAVPMRVAPAAVPLVVRVQPTPESVVRAHRYEGDLYALVAAYFPEQPDFAYFVMHCESGGNPTIFNGGNHYGLWQFDPQTWGYAYGVYLASHATPEQQTARAREVYLKRGWTPWQAAMEPWRCRR